MPLQNSDNTPISKLLPWLAGLSIFMQSLDGTILNTALPSIAKDLEQSPLEMQSVIVSYTLTLALLIPLSGWLADKFGTRKIYIFSVVFFTLGSVLCAFSNSLSTLILSRIVQAVGGAMMVPIARLAILYAYPKSQLLQVINFITIPGLIGPVVGPSLGGWLSENISWHWIFLVNIPIGAIAVWMSQKAMPNFKREVGKFDVVGLLYFSSVIVLITLILELASIGVTKWTVLLAMALAAIVVSIVYIKHAKRVDNAIIDLKLFKIRTVRIGLLGNLLTRLGIGGMPLLLPLMLQIAYGHSALVSGMMLIPSAIATLLVKPWVVPMVRKFGYRKILISNTLTLSAVIAAFSLTNATTPLLYLIPLMIVYGAINSVQMAAMNTITMADLTENNASTGNSLLAVMQQLSMSFGVSVAGLILSFFKENPYITNNEISLAFKYSFLVLGILTAISVIVFLKLKNTDGNELSGHKD